MDPNDLRDPRFDAAWRAASHDDPPQALDDAIRATARREIRAGPQAVDAPPSKVPSALRPESWLAAAATIGAIAIGLLQLATPDHVGAPASDKAVVSDMPAVSAKENVRDDTARTEPATPGAREPVAPSPSAVPAQKAPAASSETRQRVPVTPPPAQAPTLRKDAAAPAVDVERGARKSEETAQSSAPVAEPFPADPVKRESRESLASAAAPPAPMPVEAGAAGFASGKLAADATAPARSESMRDAQRAAVPRAQFAAPAPSLAARNATNDSAFDARAKVSPKLAVPDWVASIRKLRDEGNLEEAAKELAAFRTAYPDHERLLPPDLRDWKPAPR